VSTGRAGRRSGRCGDSGSIVGRRRTASSWTSSLVSAARQRPARRVRGHGGAPCRISRASRGPSGVTRSPLPPTEFRLTVTSGTGSTLRP
jgi:hypothetical protein